MDDALAGHGNQIISEAVSERVGPLEGALSGYSFTAVLQAVHDGEHVNVITAPFGDPCEATIWGRDQMGRSGSEVLAEGEHNDAEPHEDATEDALAEQVIGMTLVILRNGEIEDEYNAEF